MSFPVICNACGGLGTVAKLNDVTRHSCGSGDIDVYLGTDEQRRTAAKAASFENWMGHTALGVPQDASPDNRSGEYVGPMPGPSQTSNNEGRINCPTCHGSGKDSHDPTSECRDCGGEGSLTPTTTPRSPQVYRHQYPSTQTTVPFMGRRKSASAQLSSKRTSMLRLVARVNPGLRPDEVAQLVDNTLRTYPEIS